jgi:hypothetical protein
LQPCPTVAVAALLTVKMKVSRHVEYFCIFVIALWMSPTSVGFAAGLPPTNTAPGTTQGVPSSRYVTVPSVKPVHLGKRAQVQTSTNTHVAARELGIQTSTKLSPVARPTSNPASTPFPGEPRQAQPSLQKETVGLPVTGIKNNPQSMVLLLHNERIAYCSIPKCASTPLNRFMMRAVGLSLWNSTSHPVHRNGVPRLSSLTRSESEEVMKSPRWTRVLVVRDPVERFASAFLDKCARAIPNGNCPVSGPLRLDVQAVLSTLETQSTKALTIINPHFRPASAFCELEHLFSLFVPLHYQSCADEWVDVLANLPYLTKKRRNALATWVREAFLTHYWSPTARATNSTQLVSRWYAEASGSCKSEGAKVLARIQALYARDYSLFRNIVRPPFDGNAGVSCKVPT